MTNVVYNIREFIEILEDYKSGLQDHLLSESAEREKRVSVREVKGGARKNELDDAIIISEYAITRQEICEIKNEFGRVKMVICVLEKMINNKIN